MRVVPPLTGHLDMALSNFIVGYRQGDMLQDLLFPRVPVLRQTDKYWVFGRENLQVGANTLREFGTTPQEIRFTLSTSNYQIKSHALKANVVDEDRDTYAVGDLNTDTVSILMDQILLDREIRVRQIVTNPAVYATGNTLALASGSYWDDFTNGNPINDVNNAKRQIRRTGMKATTLFLSDDVFTSLSVNPKIRANVAFPQINAPLNEIQVATALGVPQVKVAGAINNTVGASNNFQWTNFAMLAYISPTVGAAGVLPGVSPIGGEGLMGQKQLSFGKSFTWTTAPGTIDGYGVIVARDADALKKTDVIGVDWYTDERVTGADCGFLFTTPLLNPSV